MNNTGADEDDYYKILGVDRSATAATIRKAYLKLSLKHHPDKNPDNPEAAKAQFVRIGQAYEVLSDPSQRRHYDADMRSGGGGQQQQQHHYYGGASSSHESSYQSQQRQEASFDSSSYDSYREAFDATMAGLSEEELQGVMGAAAMIGSVVGSIMGAKLLGKHANNSTLRGIGSLVGSMVASEAASSMVQTAHSQSKERVLMDQESRARGGGPAVSAKQAWKDLVKSTGKTVKERAAAAMMERLMQKGGMKSTTTDM